MSILISLLLSIFSCSIVFHCLHLLQWRPVLFILRWQVLSLHLLVARLAGHRPWRRRALISSILSASRTFSVWSHRSFSWKLCSISISSRLFIILVGWSSRAEIWRGRRKFLSSTKVIIWPINRVRRSLVSLSSFSWSSIYDSISWLGSSNSSPSWVLSLSQGINFGTFVQVLSSSVTSLPCRSLRILIFRFLMRTKRSLFLIRNSMLNLILVQRKRWFSWNLKLLSWRSSRSFKLSPSLLKKLFFLQDRSFPLI